MNYKQVCIIELFKNYHDRLISIFLSFSGWFRVAIRRPSDILSIASQAVERWRYEQFKESADSPTGAYTDVRDLGETQA